jgi:hypothetical protein
MTDRLICLGPWADSEYPNRPRPEDHIDTTWDEFERGKVSVYLERGLTIGAPLDGDGVCSLCGEKMYRGFIKTDGTYVWRSGLSHYVYDHCVRPPQQFIDHVVETCDKIDSLEFDDWQWWDSNPYSAS